MTVTTIANTRGIDVSAMAAFMLEQGFAMDKGTASSRARRPYPAHGRHAAETPAGLGWPR